MRFLFDAYHHQLRRRTTDQNWEQQVALITEVFDRDGSGDFSSLQYIFRALAAERAHFSGAAPALAPYMRSTRGVEADGVAELSPDGEDRRLYAAATRL